MDPLEAELYKRVFWMLMVSDTVLSSFKGRPRITQRAEYASRLKSNLLN